MPTKQYAMIMVHAGRSLISSGAGICAQKTHEREGRQTSDYRQKQTETHRYERMDTTHAAREVRSSALFRLIKLAWRRLSKYASLSVSL